MSAQNVSRYTADERALRRTIVLMEINDLAAIAAIRERRRTKRRLAAMVELPRIIRRVRQSELHKREEGNDR